MSWLRAVAASSLLVVPQHVQAATLLVFDDLAHGTPLSTEYSSLGVVLSSTEPIGAGLSSDGADSLGPGEAVAPFVFAVVAVPSTSAPSLPNKIIGAKFDAGGSLIQCERCGIRISFLDPLPTEVALFITDPDSGQSARFLGPGGLLGSVTIAPATSSLPEFLGFVNIGGISEIVLTSRPSVGIGFDSLEFSSPVPEPAIPSLLAISLLAAAAAMHRNRVRRPTRRCS